MSQTYVIACKLGFWQKLQGQTPLGSNIGGSSLNWRERAQLAWSVCPQTADLSFCHTIQGEDFHLLWIKINNSQMLVTEKSCQ